jgi:hypothetical protein
VQSHLPGPCQRARLHCAHRPGQSTAKPWTCSWSALPFPGRLRPGLPAPLRGQLPAQRCGPTGGHPGTEPLRFRRLGTTRPVPSRCPQITPEPPRPEGGHRGCRPGRSDSSLAFCALKGYAVTIFEAARQPWAACCGWAFPITACRREVLDREIEPLERMGVTVRTGGPSAAGSRFHPGSLKAGRLRRTMLFGRGAAPGGLASGHRRRRCRRAF